MPRYRLVVFKDPRAPWRDTKERVMQDAIRLGLASWDATAREHFLAVPVDIETDWAEPETALSGLPRAMSLAALIDWRRGRGIECRRDDRPVPPGRAWVVIHATLDHSDVLDRIGKGHPIKRIDELLPLELGGSR